MSGGRIPRLQVTRQNIGLAACFFVGNTWRRHTGVRFDAGFLETVCDLTVVTRLSRRAPCAARLAHSLGWITNTVRSGVSN
ncbi:hypothetical protein AMECASPLE_021102 [Ameca splendens]|uniref:Uncharacterized protein n=1 Tax=Ameca splendens TaxID=208324 RepID=A0ABV0XGH0_9TELE